MIEGTRREVDTSLYLPWMLAPDPLDVGIVVVILARDESDVIAGTVRALAGMQGPNDEIHVVADHCQDNTAALARKAGAKVFVRHNGGPAGKGQALRWWLKQSSPEASPHQPILVLDADSRLAPNFFDAIRERLASGAQVIQARLDPELNTSTPVVHLAAYSEIVEHRVNDSIRGRLGWPVRLRGTGMIFRRAILEQVADSLHTFVEDAELTLLLASRGILIEYAVETRVIDPKPNDSAGAMRQRARWLKGQTQLLRSYPLQIGRLLLAGPKGWSLLSSVLLKPKTLLTPLKALLVVMTWLFALTAGGPLLSLLAIAGAISLAADAGVYLYGLRYVNDRRATVRALLLAPLFLGLWMRSLAMSMMVGNGWLRVRPRQTRNSYTDRSASSFINTEPTPLVHPRRAEAYAPVIANKEWRVVSRSGVEAAGD